ncbi:MAG: hypothetical protein BRC40_11390 [Cyanobacteria bacterium QH_8_48_120]|jgi:hypothetical protein|nr:MAG: hypothetical protein BRC34_07485 [Cyanobacteria bacterium QH_1_48_107]PSO58957.1 MAG: hypothetical protein BRC35_04815 [Cyanobacteria bacterium QH_10_48_56]PSO63505.1 MAG: hypothetical protein BRC39_04365 [Cyanobacteria bacterium QH_7_48_89]PSO64679.1 MAG: hypothetical protein BRC36_06030 [Cyanobacteria bacterium QH_2_48_84]PSO66948.1 MAG: hypothetical protein BRC38_04260 [Cyanobacteria bacterium QH_6_48_35]PSO71616.1 MAG: hypothetical protein BRC42_07575 [Cyanobacteria bacterium QS_1_
MFSQLHYLIRSRVDGQYLVAHPDEENQSGAGYLLIFSESFDARSYLNTHGSDVAEQFGVESVSATQLKGVLQRWGFAGVGLVQEPLVPQIQFLSYS